MVGAATPARIIHDNPHFYRNQKPPRAFKEGFQADRLSDSRYMANLFRLYMHSLAASLLTLLRREVANPPRRFRTDQDCPREALAEPDRRRYFNRRRQEDPLGEGHACTWRTRLIKVAAEIVSLRPPSRLQPDSAICRE